MLSTPFAGVDNLHNYPFRLHAGVCMKNVCGPHEHSPCNKSLEAINVFYHYYRFDLYWRIHTLTREKKLWIALAVWEQILYYTILYLYYICYNPISKSNVNSIWNYTYKFKIHIGIVILWRSIIAIIIFKKYQRFNLYFALD